MSENRTPRSSRVRPRGSNSPNLGVSRRENLASDRERNEVVRQIIYNYRRTWTLLKNMSPAERKPRLEGFLQITLTSLRLFKEINNDFDFFAPVEASDEESDEETADAQGPAGGTGDPMNNRGNAARRRQNLGDTLVISDPEVSSSTS
ncbi:uncharacterized protein LOC115623103 [Scaptodrosophila lebanonensis]|uniref:Uncharacterized protein LOC115623103 n=1 Tax=Drosophila lebanonensis TaxID=7225 RepID=A0A6J2TDG6_DROLE|nr:uncharacterized protein LOC115623103 [Scaptodrosophila lebanonensis]XP_030373169.1 uncharacterized protein LOC115623103 [Scaptodrosophila lebanonensis]